MDLLITPISIGQCTLSNRLVFTAASLCRSPGGVITDALVDCYRARAKGGAGLLIAGGASVTPDNDGDSAMIGAWDAQFLPGLTRLAETTRETESKIFLQLLHPGPYEARPTDRPLGPSVFRSGMTGKETHAMTTEEIHKMTAAFGDAALRAKTAGFDGIELCASVGYLLASFLSPARNQREDEYGGSVENRTRLVLEILADVKAKCGTDFPVIVRISGMDGIRDGNTPEDAAQIAKLLEAGGADAISVTGGWHESKVPQITGQAPHGAWRGLVRAVKQHVSIPVIGGSRLDVPSSRQAIAAGDFDLAGLCRPILADPELPNKVLAGREHTIHQCLACNQNCLDSVFAGKPVGCAINPWIGKECNEHSVRFHGEKILVVGAGISGMTFAALTAKENDVTILEQQHTYGGAARLLANLSSWEDCGRYLDSLYQDCLEAGVSFRFNTQVSVKELERLVAEEGYDRVCIASGGGISAPSFPVADGVRVIPWDRFVAQEFPMGKHTVILGNDFRALEIAVTCAAKQQKQEWETDTFFRLWNCEEKKTESSKVTCLGAAEKAGGGMARSTRWVALREATLRGVDLIGGATITEVTSDSVLYELNGETHTLPADTIVLAQGWTSSKTFTAEAIPEALRARCHWIGDASAMGRIPEAVRSAAALSLEPTDREVAQ